MSSGTPISSNAQQMINAVNALALEVSTLKGKIDTLSATVQEQQKQLDTIHEIVKAHNRRNLSKGE